MEPDRADDLKVSFKVTQGSPWFDGHFPGKPILPGVALLQHAWKVARGSFGDGIKLAGFSRVKFKRIVRPGEKITVQVDLSDGQKSGPVPFEVLVEDQKCCSGYFLLHSTSEASGSHA